MGWNAEREELLKQLWSDGLSCSQIAQRLGDVSRSAVIGKVRRLGLSGRSVVQRKPVSRPARISKERTAFVAGRAPFPRHPRFAVVASSDPQLPLPLVLPAERKQLADLDDHDCRFPIGDPKEADFGFCARPKVTGTPYCTEHCRVAFQPPQPVRRIPIIRPIEAPAEQPRVEEVA